MVEDELDAGHKGLAHLYQVFDAFSVSKDSWQHPEKVLVTVDLSGSYSQCIDISRRRVNIELVGPEREDLSA